MSESTMSFVGGLKNQYAEVSMVSIGSSLKLCMVAEGGAQLYPRFAPTMEWDTAAGQAIVENAGGEGSIVISKVLESLRGSLGSLSEATILIS